MSGTLYVVATPIGNLEDLSPRARQTLAAVDLIAAEDTRHTGRLLSHFGVKTRLLALHDHNEADRADTVIEALRSGQSVALVSDAGTPLISDPGYRVVQAAHDAGLTVSPVPGPSALAAALSVAGLPTDRFCFEGFLPSKQKARRDRLAGLAGEPRTMLFYESVHRVGDCIDDMIETFGEDRLASISRELSKLHEQVRLATLGQLREQLAAGDITAKGEFVIVVAGAVGAGQSSLEADELLKELAGKLPDKEVARIAANVTGEKRNALYKRLLDL
ncbi:MAG: 16S rRNA (cytidine(1402)-2'-O)-methyltransferase [Woeseiaceae bacterium]|nr:16S rRNA (cytidine(1402)-2'-O)-methyltransferase [Woeseiaceae bacterium]